MSFEPVWELDFHEKGLFLSGLDLEGLPSSFFVCVQILGRVSERTVCDPFFKHATVGYVVTWLRSFTNGSCSVTMQPCLVNWLQLRLRPVTKVSYRNQVSYRNRMGLRGNGN